MCLSVRSSNGLMRAGANTFGKVKEIMEQENGLRTIRNLGVKSEKEIKLCFFNSCYSLLNAKMLLYLFSLLLPWLGPC